MKHLLALLILLALTSCSNHEVRSYTLKPSVGSTINSETGYRNTYATFGADIQVDVK